MQLTAIERYPVKSMQGESLSESAIASGGLLGDRCWAVRDEKRGGIRGAKVIHELMQFAARYPQGVDLRHAAERGVILAAEIELAGGRRTDCNDPEINDILSDALAHPVTLWPLQPADNRAHYQRGAPVLADPEREFRRMFARTDDEPLPDLRQFPAELAEYESPPGTYFDAYPILLATTGSLQRVAEAHAAREPGTQIDMRRFRPNLVLESGGADGLLEAGWAGKRLKIGDCVLQAEIPCPRCIMTTLPFAELTGDPKIMRTLVQSFGGNFGLYASVLEPGHVKLGDTLKVLG